MQGYLIQYWPITLKAHFYTRKNLTWIAVIIRNLTIIIEYNTTGKNQIFRWPPRSISEESLLQKLWISILWRELSFHQMFFFQKLHIILHYVPTGKILTGFKFVSPEKPADAARTPKQRIYFLLVFCIRMKSLL